MATYTELAEFVKDWSNRDTGVLSYDTIRQCIRYAHDETYRTLRIAPLEITREGTVTSAQVDQGYLTIEDDLVEFIQLRKRADEGPRSYSSFDKPYIVAEAHSDARSFNGDTVTLYSDYSFYREGTQIHIFPLIQEGEVWELFYYRRLPEVNERFEIDELFNDLGLANTNIGILGIESLANAKITFDNSIVPMARFAVGNQIEITRALPADLNGTYNVTAVTNSIADGTVTITTDTDNSTFTDVTNLRDVRASWTTDVKIEDFNRYFELFSTPDADDPSDPPTIDLPLADREADTTLPNGLETEPGSGVYNLGETLSELGLVINYGDTDAFADDSTFVGVLKEQWLRDTNEKVLLFGALHQAFDYLDEADQSGKYKAKFEQEIQKLNKEEMDRMNSGGNINVNFYNRLI